MFKRLQQKWNVGGWQFCCILLVFAVTGSTTAWLSKNAPVWLGMDTTTDWWWRLLLRLAILIFGYQVVLLCTAFLFGQFNFFWQYEKKLLRWMGKLVGSGK